MNSAIMPRENPIFVKHWRARLRRQHFWPLLAIIAIISLCLAWSAIAAEISDDAAPYYTNDGGWMVAFICFLALQGFLLFLLGSANVGNSVAQARETGMMDFHRVSPLSPATLTLGFLFGGPIREYLLFATTLPFYLALILPKLGDYPGLLLLPVAMLLLGVLYHVTALVIGLSVPKTQLRGAGAAVAVLPVLLHVFWFLPPLAYLSIIPTTLAAFGSFPDVPIANTFFGVDSPRFLLTLIHLLPLVAFLWIAAVRRMRRERALAFSRPVTLLFYLVIALLTLGDAAIIVTGYGEYRSTESFGPIIVLYVMLVAGLFLIMGATPGMSAFVTGLRHAKKLGRSLSSWTDTAPNGPLLLGLCAVLLLTAINAFLAATGAKIMIDHLAYLFATLSVLFTLIFFGGALQSLLFFFRKNGAIYFAFTLFLLWLVPLLVGMLSNLTGENNDTMLLFFSLTPITGISLSMDAEYGLTYRLFTLCACGLPAVVAALCYPIAVHRAIDHARDAEASSPAGVTVEDAPITPA